MTFRKERVPHSAMIRPLAAEIRETDDGVQIVVSISENQVDPTSLALKTVTFEEHELHEGNHFFYSDSVELNNGSSQDYLLTAPNTDKHVHMVGIMDGTAITQFLWYEGTNKTGTALQTAFNSNRNSSRTPGLTIHKGTVGTSDGTLIRQYKGGSATGVSSRAPSENRNEHELILRAGMKYILRVTSFTNANLTNVRFVWHENVRGEG